MQNRIKHPLGEYIYIIVGVLLYAIATNLIFDPLNLVTGGVSGLAIVVKYLTSFAIPGGMPLWLFNVLSNIPLFIASYMILGKGFLKKTLFATIAMTVALYIVPTVSIVGEDYILGAVFGGVITGIGTAFIFCVMASTGGTDLIALMIHNYKRYYTIPQILIVIDAVIIFAGIIVFGVNRALYAAIAIYIATKVSDMLLEGLKFAKMAYIISDHYEEIANEIMETMSRGVTGIQAKGMYSQEDKKMLFCVVGKKEIVKISEIAKRRDPDAFIIVSDVREVLGEGFMEYKQ